MLSELDKRAGPPDTDRDAWMAFRRGGITATEVRDLVIKGASFRQDLLDAKRSGVDFEDLSHIPAVAHGKAREPFLEAYAAGFGIKAEHRVFYGENPRHLASPDGLGLDFDECLIGFEGKTSKYDISHAETVGYHLQIQWCMHVTGARRWLLVWEQHEDFEPMRIVHEWIDRDDETIADLVRVADDFLAELDQPRVRDLVAIRKARARYSAAKARRDKYAAEMDAAADELRDLVGEGAVDLGAYRVSVSEVKPGTRFDAASFKKADPETYSKWMRPTAAGKPRVTVTKKETKE